MSVEGQVALITGAGRGIGRATALRLSKAGAKVILAARSEAEISEVQSIISKSGGTALSVPTDVTDAAAVRRLVQAGLDRWGGVDLLINNAGVALFDPILSSTEEQWRRMFDVNVLGAVRLVQEVLPHMLEARKGRIVMVASTASHKAYRNQAGYVASKHALLGFSRVLMEELRGMDVTVHLVSPGGVDTALARSNRDSSVTEEYMDPEEVAEAVHFICANRGLGTVDEIILRRRKASPML